MTTMNKIVMLFQCVAAISNISMALDINVIRTNDEVEQFSLSDVESITVSVENSTADTQEYLRIHTPHSIYHLIASELDSFYFNDEGTIGYFQTSQKLEQFKLADIDSMTFSSTMDSTVYIIYNDDNVSVANPLEHLGVSIQVANADVVVNSTADISNIGYVLSGTTDDDMFKINSEKKLNLHLNDVHISNNDGPAINIQTGKKITVQLEDGTTNTLCDGEIYATAPEGEEQNAAFFSEGQLICIGSGYLEINASCDSAHGLRSDDCIRIEQGNITINSAVKDGIHANDGFYMNGGTLNISSEGDGIDGGAGAVEIADGNITIHNSQNDNNAINCDSTIT
jgi:hypothetical protein